MREKPLDSETDDCSTFVFGLVVYGHPVDSLLDKQTFISVSCFRNWDRYRACCDPPGEIQCNVTKYMDAPPESSDCAKVIHDIYDDPDFK